MQIPPLLNRRVRHATAALLLALAGCAQMPAEPPVARSDAVTNRPDGEGYAGVGELLVRIGMPRETGWRDALLPSRQERSFVEIRYLGLDPLGRAVFERHDGDALAAAAPAGSLPTSARGTVLTPAAPGAVGASAPLPANTREVALDMRLSRELRIQGKIVEVLEATATGVVFRLY